LGLASGGKKGEYRSKSGLVKEREVMFKFPTGFQAKENGSASHGPLLLRKLDSQGAIAGFRKPDELGERFQDAEFVSFEF